MTELKVRLVMVIFDPIQPLPFLAKFTDSSTPVLGRFHSSITDFFHSLVTFGSFGSFGSDFFYSLVTFGSFFHKPLLLQPN